MDNHTIMKTSGRTTSLWTDFHDTLYSFITHRISNRLDAEDLLADVFVKIHTKMETVEDEGKLRGWIYRLTRNSIIDYYRARKEMYSLPDSAPITDEDSEGKNRIVIAGWIKAMLKYMPDEYFQALKLYELDGLSQAEVAEKLGLSLANTKTRIQRGRERLKDMIVDCCDVEIDSRGRVYDYFDRSGKCVACQVN